MPGSVAGDVVGSVYERNNIKSRDFPLFTDNSRFTGDTVLTAAVAHAVLGGLDYGETIKKYGLKYPFAGYDGAFRKWLFSSKSEPYNSWGNGSAMRVSAVGWGFETSDELLKKAGRGIVQPVDDRFCLIFHYLNSTETKFPRQMIRSC